ncbi:branched-chain amino acid ABC transporter permease [Pseudothauera nasutitermitis]|uniref:Branched-chain amino acid ABC transporter permease n=1 Tax=Pseudothauera nasutitermitis TaxID=2565930 RepID=A0A4V3WBD7_9RHOO|nr:branched-chain amino acid ABC transporter permease [Pseudothauera nasutitermitis]THF62809.1 branched-chain amino acid ABC transporter permease [Pseudothauera nasutitermitis]
MTLLDFLNFYLVPGIVLGAIYAVGAIGITLVFGILRFAHFAHGDMATLGAFIALALAASGMDPWVALPLAMAITAVIAIGVDRSFYDYLSRRPKILTVMASLGVALMLRAVVQVVWGVDPTTYVTGIVRPEEYFGILLRPRELNTLLTVVLIVVGLELFLRKSKWGKAMRAMSDNPDLARLSGVDNRKVTMLTWAIVGALCTASGFMLGINTELHSMMGWQLLLPMFAAAILGGVGRVQGAVLGGLIVGITEELSVFVVPAQYKAATAFALLLIILLVRPRGLLNGKVL